MGDELERPSRHCAKDAPPDEVRKLDRDSPPSNQPDEQITLQAIWYPLDTKEATISSGSTISLFNL